MRIHSSSLTFTPVGFNRKVTESNSAQNKDQNDLSAAKDAQYKNNPTSLPNDIKKTLDSVKLAKDVTIQDNIIRPTDSRTLKALSAYTQELNAPLQDRSAQLITGIDAYA